METEKRWISSEVLFSAICEQLAEGRQAAFTVTGMSMWPFLRHGADTVVLEQAEPDQIRKGDIVLVRVNPGRYLLHRVTACTENQVETTGDGNCFRDGFFQRDQVLARAVKLIRSDRTIDCADPRWKLAFRCWMVLYPVRRPMMSIWKRIRK